MKLYIENECVIFHCLENNAMKLFTKSEAVPTKKPRWFLWPLIWMSTKKNSDVTLELRKKNYVYKRTNIKRDVVGG